MCLALRSAMARRDALIMTLLHSTKIWSGRQRPGLRVGSASIIAHVPADLPGESGCGSKLRDANDPVGAVRDCAKHARHTEPDAPLPYVGPELSSASAR
jgi:hypothetical protein